MDHQSPRRSPEIHAKFHVCHFARKYVLLQTGLDHKKGIIQNATDFLLFCYTTVVWFLLNMDL
jgi:hypothetical protein